MNAAQRFALKTETHINAADELASFCIWLGNDSEPYAIGVRPLTTEEREDRRIDDESDDTHKLSDGYGEDQYFGSFTEAVGKAWDYFQETQAQNFNEGVLGIR